LRKFAGFTLADVRNVLPDDVDVLDDDQWRWCIRLASAGENCKRNKYKCKIMM
jgi:hypothetical protein